MSIPGFGPITASAMAATIQDASSFAGPHRRRLSRADAQAELLRRQATAGAYLEDGQSELRKLLVVGRVWLITGVRPEVITHALGAFSTYAPGGDIRSLLRRSWRRVRREATADG